MSKYKHLLFDVDGTLVDSYDVNNACMLEMLKLYSPERQVTTDELNTIFGIPGLDALRMLGASDEQIPEMLQQWEALIRTHAQEFKLFPHVIPVLELLKERGFHMALVTSRSRDCNMGGPLGKVLPEPVRPFMERVICADDTKRPKPYPDPLLLYMEQTGARREEILFIGDAATDLQAARSAGVDFALALWGYHGKDFLYCDHYLKSMWEVANLCTQKDKDESFAAQLHVWAREINAIGQIGLAYCKDRFDRERYERLQDIAAQMAACYVDEQVEIIKKNWCTEGYKTPQIDTRAAIFDDQGRILMVKEKLSGKWNIPGGWCDENLSLIENVVKEVREEANMDVYGVRLIAVQERSRHNVPDSIMGCLKTFIECRMGPGEFVDNIETSERRFFAEDEIPLDELRISTCTYEQLKMCFACHRDPHWQTVVE